ncbi:MAG: MerR family transcriptional regulator [Eubacterium sp.]|nr:MerR family transcriptional regulator [Eubacterium sp.]
MKINEVEQQVGITKKNIRFYEQQGLLNPKRNMENGYRDYTEADVEELKKIKLLRKLSLPIEEIRRIQSGGLLLEDALQRQLIILEREKINLQETSNLCHYLMEKQCKYPSLTPDEYLERMVEMEKEGTTFMNVSQNDIIQKKRGSILAAGTFIIFMLFLVCVMVWGYITDPIPLWMLGVFILIPIAVSTAVIIALLQRMKEIEGGEEDAARKY